MTTPSPSSPALPRATAEESPDLVNCWGNALANQDMLNTATASAPRGLYNDACSLLTVYAYLRDHNTATDIVTGNNMIQSSFAGAAGIPVVIQNSGANVLIQNATVVNLQFK